MKPAAAAILEGMPDPGDLRRAEHQGTTFISAGSSVLFCYPAGDAGMRNVAVAVLRQLGFGGRAVAAVMGLTENYVATLHNRALREGAAGVVRDNGRPRKLAGASWERARRWRAEGVSDAEIARRLGVHHATVARRLGPAGQGELPLASSALAPGGGPAPDAGVRQPDAAAGAAPAPVPGPAAGHPAGVPQPAAGAMAGQHASRYAGAMLLHAFWDRIGAGAILAAALPPGLARPRYDDLALLTATSAAFALGASSAEGTRHLIPAQAGVLAGMARLPELRTLRPRLARIADGCDPLALQRQLAAAMLAADAPGLHVYYVDDHFVPYEGARPVAKGWNTKRRHAQPGRADTMVTDYHGRAVCFATGDPSGLAATLPGALAQLRQVTGEQAKILLGFDRGGSYPVAFRAIAGAHADWVTWRRGPPVAAPRRSWVARSDGKPAGELWLADEMVTIKDYGQCRQITLLEDGAPVLQVLTSDTAAPAAALLAWLRCRWRIENLFKYLEDNYGIHWMSDYHASLEDDTRLTGNPERKAARSRLKAAGQALADAERELAGVISAPGLSAAAKNKAIPAAQKKITKARDAVAAAKAALKHIPAELPASQVHPGAQKAILRTRRRSLQMVLRLLAASAENWLATRLNDYLRDSDEYRAITRNLLHLGGQITYHPAAITVTLDTPAPPRLARALALLLDEINATPPRMPGDQRPITYRLAAQPAGGPDHPGRTRTAGDVSCSWAVDAVPEDSCSVVLPDDVVCALGAHAGIQRVELTGSRASGRATPLSDWDFKVVTADFDQVRDALPRLVVPLRPVVAQWDRLSRTWCYMLILHGPAKVDLIFGQPHAAMPPWRATASTLRGIDDHFWDWALWLRSKQAAGRLGLVAAELGKLHEHLLGPLGVTPAPATIELAITGYRAARDEWERRLGRQIPRAAEEAVMGAVCP